MIVRGIGSLACMTSTHLVVSPNPSDQDLVDQLDLAPLIAPPSHYSGVLKEDTATISGGGVGWGG